MTGLPMTDVPFLGNLVSTKDDKNSAKNSFSNLFIVLITVCITYCRACVSPPITNSLRSANKYPSIFAKTTKFKNSFICYGLSHYQLTA